MGPITRQPSSCERWRVFHYGEAYTSRITAARRSDLHERAGYRRDTVQAAAENGQGRPATEGNADGHEAEEVAETKSHRIQGSALRWPFSAMVLASMG